MTIENAWQKPRETAIFQHLFLYILLLQIRFKAFFYLFEAQIVISLSYLLVRNVVSFFWWLWRAELDAL